MWENYWNKSNKLINYILTPASPNIACDDHNNNHHNDDQWSWCYYVAVAVDFTTDPIPIRSRVSVFLLSGCRKVNPRPSGWLCGLADRLQIQVSSWTLYLRSFEFVLILCYTRLLRSNLLPSKSSLMPLPELKVPHSWQQRGLIHRPTLG
jgi:hypothetical protein